MKQFFSYSQLLNHFCSQPKLTQNEWQHYFMEIWHVLFFCPKKKLFKMMKIFHLFCFIFARNNGFEHVCNNHRDKYARECSSIVGK